MIELALAVVSTHLADNAFRSENNAVGPNGNDSRIALLQARCSLTVVRLVNLLLGRPVFRLAFDCCESGICGPRVSALQPSGVDLQRFVGVVESLFGPSRI